jgi:2-polyprenyl-3-methyl-5-hydroxy-6-metoxy-1,4-benzoquinol methylase
MTAVADTVVTTKDLTTEDEQRRDALTERLFGSLLAGNELLTVELGRRLGLYTAVHSQGQTTPAQLAARTGIAQRYATEWLEQQAAAGFLDVDGDHFTLPAAHVPVLLVDTDPAHLMGAAPMLAALAATLPAVAAAYHSGGGVPYEEFGTELRHGIAAFNRPAFTNDLTGWLETMPDVASRLSAGGRVLDLGCGTGWSSIAIAQAFPAARVHGVDTDTASIDEARRHAAHAGVAERVTFTTANAADAATDEPYDLACAFEALHDMGEPVRVLRAARAALAPGAPVLIVDERVSETFTTPADEVERMMYSFSVLHCLPATMAESTAVANGTMLRPATLRDWARQAGYPTIDVLPIENPFWRFYRLDTDATSQSTG